MLQRPTIAIAGAGLGGLTAALLLARSGFDVRMFERQAVLSTAGAGIQITPNAASVLALLGLDTAVGEFSAEPQAIVVRSGARDRVLATMPLGDAFTRQFGIPYRTIHRADLHGILAAAAAAEPRIHLETGAAVSDVRPIAAGLDVFVAERQDAVARVDAVIGADGIGSRIRQAIPGARDRVPTDLTAWRAIIPRAAVPAGMPMDSVVLWLAAGGHVVCYPVRRGAEFNIVAVVPDDGRGVDRPDRHFASWAPLVQTLLAAAGNWTPWPIATVDPAGPWSSGRIALLGDAAHAMPPYLAQGGAMAIEDAAVLAESLARSGSRPDAGIAAYEEARRQRVVAVWRAAKTTARIYHLPPLPAAVRNAGMKVLGGQALIDRYAWIYRWRPPSE